jgi:DNA-binding transcriptional regulator YiaG
MPNIAAVLKQEISRIARREIRNETASLKKASSQYRRDIAELKRQVSNLQRRIPLLEKQMSQNAPSQVTGANATNVRFTAKGLLSQRQRLGLSAADYGKLIGVTAQTIYSWENGLSRPRKQQLPALASIRPMGKREARGRLEQLTRSSRK